MLDDYDEYLDLSLDTVLKGDFDGSYKIDFDIEKVEEEEEEESEDWNNNYVIFSLIIKLWYFYIYYITSVRFGKIIFVNYNNIL